MAGITITGLSKTYGDPSHGLAAVSDLDFAIDDGTFVTILGPSGCGKTTTLRLIAGYLTPDAGTIRVGDEIVSSRSGTVSPDRRGMGMVFQNYAVWPHKTVFENVVFGLKLRGIAREDARRQVAKALDLVSLGGLADRYPGELSGGQQQRVALARSLVVEPGILLLDEPLSNLDAKLRERMRKELKELQRRTGITFVYVTHDQAEALALSDRIVVMDRGRLQQVGTPWETYNRPANRMVADFMGLVNLAPAVVTAQAGGSVRLTEDEIELAVTLPAGLTVGDKVELSIRPESIRLTQAGTSADPGGDARATVIDHTFLGNIREYSVKLPSGRVLRVQTHPDVEFAGGAEVEVAIDTRHCSAFPSASPTIENEAAA